jgi:hypothetical protein
LDPLEEKFDEKVVNFTPSFFYPTQERIVIAIAGILMSFLGYLVLGGGLIPGSSGASVGAGASSAVFLIAFVPLCFSGIAQYFCYSPILTIAIAVAVSYLVACYMTAHDFKYILVDIAVYLLLLSVVFKLLTFLYLPTACN